MCGERWGQGKERATALNNPWLCVDSSIVINNNKNRHSKNIPRFFGGFGFSVSFFAAKDSTPFEYAVIRRCRSTAGAGPGAAIQRLRYD
jgi:hypothetical protein